MRNAKACDNAAIATPSSKSRFRDSDLMAIFLRLPTGRILAQEGVMAIQNGLVILVLTIVVAFMPKSRLGAFRLRSSLNITKFK